MIIPRHVRLIHVCTDNAKSIGECDEYSRHTSAPMNLHPIAVANYYFRIAVEIWYMKFTKCK